MKKLIFFLCVAFLGFWSTKAQEHEYSTSTEPSLLNRLNIIEKKTDKLNIYFNYHGSFDVLDEGTEKWGANFRTNLFRLEFRGNLTDKIFYRFRHRLNKSNKTNERDNFSSATDIFYAGYRFNDKFTFIFGKQPQNWGGYEYDADPTFIYEFSDYGNNVDCFQMGATFSYMPNKNNEFVFQITDNSTKRFEEMYNGGLLAQGFEKSRTPFSYILNWNGNLFDNKIQTRWAVGLQTEAKENYTYTVSLGTRLNLGKFQMYFDYMMDNSDIDRLGIVTNEILSSPVGDPNCYALEDVKYNSFIAKAEYQPAKNWNLFVKGMYETASSDQFEDLDNFRKSYGYFAGVEYLPFEDQNLRVFLTYVGRKVKYESNFLNDFDSNRVSLGIIYKLKAF